MYANNLFFIIVCNFWQTLTNCFYYFANEEYEGGIKNNWVISSSEDVFTAVCLAVSRIT